MVKHVLKNGKTITDISGYIVKAADAKRIYALLDKINRERRTAKNGNV